MGSIPDLVRDLRGFTGRRVLVRELRAEIRKPVDPIRLRIRAAALALLPHRGGLGVWVASSRITAQIRLSGRSAGVTLKGGRNSARGRSDIRAIDAGRVRAPSWGRRGPGAWHTQSVVPDFFSGPAGYDAGGWARAIDIAVDHALDTIRRG
jgi:hypothetical protein